MIKFCDNQKDIIDIWKSVFGDSEDEIQFFIDNAKNAECLSCYLDENLVSMLYLVDCSIDNKNGKYIYAACTKKEYEGSGLMSELLDYSKKLGYNFLCLIPANDSLVDFYSKRGFDKDCSIESLTFNQSDEIKEYLLEGFTLTQPKVLICEV
jgi:predicted acetyltransferase